MSEFKSYRKKGVQPMRPYIPGEDLTGINVDKGTVPEAGGMIAVDPNNPSDQWYIAPGYFAQYYEPAETEKTLHNSDISGARVNVPDIKVVGNGDQFRLLCKASSQKEGWMKSTKAMHVPGVGCVVQITTQQKNPDGSYAVAEALTFVPGTTIVDDENNGRKLVMD